MRKHATLIAIALVALLAFAACGGDGPSPASSTTPAASPTVAQGSPTPVQPAVTPALSPDEAIQTICLTVEQSYPEIEEEVSQPIAETVQRILTALGLEVVAQGTPCDAILMFALTGEALGADYNVSGGGSQFCYTGAEVDGEMTLTMPGRSPLTVPISGREPPNPGVITHCPYQVAAPFDRPWPRAVLNGLTSLWPTPQVFLHALADENEDVRTAAAEELEESGSQETKDTISAFIQALRDQDKDVRVAAAEGLGAIGPEAVEAVPALIQALQDEDEDLRVAAAMALVAITGQDFGDEADRWQQWWGEQQ